MDTTTISIQTDRETKRQAQRIFEALGLDMATAIDIFLRQTVRQREMPFPLTMRPEKERQTQRRPLQYDCLKGRIWTADDFDAPLDDFKEYM